MDSDYKINGIKSSTVSASIDHVLIDTESLTTVSGTTPVPKSVYESPKKERDISTSQLLIDQNKTMEQVIPELANEIDNLLQNQDASARIKKGNVIVVLNSNIYGSALGGDVQEANLTFVQKWNQVKNDLDIGKLRSDFDKLISLLQKNVSKDDHFTDLANITLAKDELRRADGPAMLKYLGKIGNFGMDIAKGMGSSILAQLLMGGL